MVDLLLDGGVLLTQDDERTVFDDGAVAIDDGRIVAVGPRSDVADAHDPRQTIDTTGHVVCPGFVDAHLHTADVLLRGRSGHDRALFDWLYNVKSPGLAAMDANDHALATRLVCAEATRAGITTLVDNDLEGGWYDGKPEAKLDAYAESGLRVAYARGFLDEPPDAGFEAFVDDVTAREPGVEHVPLEELVEETAHAIGHAEDLIETHHGRANGRLSVWVAPAVVEGVSPEGLRAARQLAVDHGVSTTTHVAETAQQAGDTLSAVEYLRNVGYLGPETLLGHCVHVDDRDARLLAGSGTRVAHNLLTNLRLGAGLAPVETLRARGVPVGLGTDNPSLSDTVDVLGDARFAATVHDGAHEDPGRVRAQAALDMATREGARAVGMADVGSLEAGTPADVVAVDCDRPGLVPRQDPVTTLVYGASGRDVTTVVCDGEVLLRDAGRSRVERRRPDLLDRARAAATRIADTAGLPAASDAGEGRGHR
ncbi:amidohydrolase [Haloglomus litoreum]|uniref:amidohydrolase family protein n=1 Tax=Haloglomus litoreum TaxID=3034026 RepID=UPI0023E8C532|nr:amidohydrolase [Haloglomus sp. DT116]